jgi:amylosucrase
MILLLHSMILSFGGIPLIYYGDEIGTLNSDSYRDDPLKAGDSRWVHRPWFDWDKAERRNSPATVEYKIFTALKQMISIRKEITVFADFNNRELIEVENPHLFVFGRYHLQQPSEQVLVVANFSEHPQHLNLDDIGTWKAQYGTLVDLYCGESPDIFKNSLVIPGYSFYWLCEK